MKNYAKFVLIFGIFMITGIILFVILSGDSSEVISADGENVLILNDITKDAEAKFNSPDSLGEKDYGVDFVVIDNNGKEVYKSSGAEEKIMKIFGGGNYSAEDAGRRRLYKHVIKDGRILGTVIILELPEEGFKIFKAKLVLGLVVMALIFLIGAVIYGIYIDKTIVKPFKRMQSFAGKVAEGKLDEPLMMEKSNMFGTFTESFDIMREELAESKKREIELQRKEKELIALLQSFWKLSLISI